MKNYFECVLLVLSPLLIALFSLILASGDIKEGLPFCEVSDVLDRIVLVSTLDGKISALDPAAGGSLLWTVHPGHEPMLSSSIHRLELTNYGQLVRMIPSLNGGLYRFNGETVEPIPLTAELLLQSSFRYSDDLVISGGKESQTVGVSLRTGEVLYECSMRGCSDEGNRAVGDVLLVQRMGQIVRAVEPRSGTERWNFSVAQHDLKLLSECHNPGPLSPRLNLKVIVPEGLICAVNSASSDGVLWKHKFDSPVVSAWEIQKDNIFEVDLFSRSSQFNSALPSLYIGMHEKQLYIQESVTMLEKRRELAANFGKNMITYEKGLPQFPWRPVLAGSENTGLLDDVSDDMDNSSGEVPTTALSVLYASPYVDGMGFYLYTKEETEAQECNITIPSPPEEVEEDTPVTIVIVSLWYWWKEVMLISLTSAIFINIIFTRRYLRFRKGLDAHVELPISNTDSGVILEAKPRHSESDNVDFVSRYLSDFEPVHCLGKGGFGVVFEARNKIDDCNYAIKRIVLPDSSQSRERVMREVRALAKLEHQNIVRYFNSWTECPPPGWQREQDRHIKSVADSAFKSDTVSEGDTNCFPFPSKSIKSGPRSFSSPYSGDDSFIVFASDSEDALMPKQPCCQLKEHSIVIENTRSQSENSDKSSKEGLTDVEMTEQSAICESPSKVYLYIQMQLCKKESLKDWLLQNPNREYESIMNIFKQINNAVRYIHSCELIHRDLKPSNIFFSMDQQIKVGDFGLVTSIADDGGQTGEDKEKSHRHTSQVGTQLYMSPEQLSGKPYSFKVDIFSLGLILFELLVPFSTQMERLKILEGIKTHKFPVSFKSEYDIEHKILMRMLSHVPEERPTTSHLHSTLFPLEKQIDEWPKRHRRESSRTSFSSVSSSEAVPDFKTLNEVENKL